MNMGLDESSCYSSVAAFKAYCGVVCVFGMSTLYDIVITVRLVLDENIDLGSLQCVEMMDMKAIARCGD